MTDDTVLHVALETLIVAAKIAGPILLVSIVIGFAISVFQSATQIQDQTLSFVPKLIGVSLVLLLSGRWMIGEFVDYTHQLFASLPSMLN